jgi:hypothetical protein
LIKEKELIQNKEIDCNFANKYNLSINNIFHYNQKEKLMEFTNSPLINGIKDPNEAKQVINEYITVNNLGKKGDFYHLRD